MTTLAKIALAHHVPNGRRAPSPQETAILANRIWHLPSRLETEPLDETSLDEFLFRMSFQQFQFQPGDDQSTFGRALIIFRDIPSDLRINPPQDFIDIPEAFQEYTGLSIEQFIWTGAMIFGGSLKRPILKATASNLEESRVRERWQGPKDEMPTPESLEIFLRNTALSTTEFKTRIGDLRRREIDERTVSTDFHPLLTYPVVRLNSNEIQVPIPSLLLDRITSGIFFDLSEHLDHGAGHPESRFRTFFGKIIFEEYVRRNLNRIYNDSELQEETLYDSDEPSTPDWLADNPKVPLAVECRTSTFRKKTRIESTLELIRHDVERIYGDPIRKFPLKIAPLLSGTPNAPVHFQSPPYMLLCTYESHEPLESVGKLVMETYADELAKFQSPLHLVPIPYLERLCSLNSAQEFAECLQHTRVSKDWLAHREKSILSDFVEHIALLTTRPTLPAERFQHFTSWIQDVDPLEE